LENSSEGRGSALTDVGSFGVGSRALLESVPDAVLVVDDEGSILYANARCESLFGYDPGDLVGRTVEDLVPESHAVGHARRRERYRRRPRLRHMGAAVDLVARHRDGHPIPVEVSLSPLDSPRGPLVVASIRDIREKLALRSALREGRERTHAILRSMRDALIATDGAGRVTHMNLEAEWLTGTSVDRAVGKRLDDVLCLQDAHGAGVVGLPVGITHQGADVLASLSDARVVRPTGEVREVSASCAPIVGASGKSAGTVLVLRDVTERHELQRRAEVAEHLATLGTLTAGIAHEINSPLTYVFGNLELALRRLEQLRAPTGGEAATEGELRRIAQCVAEALDGVDRMRVIVGDLRVVGRPGSASVGPVELAAVVEAALRISMGELMRKAEVVRDYRPAPDVRANATGLVQVVINLLVNAAQALPDPRREESRIWVRIGSDDRGGFVAIEDNGEGIPEHLKPRVFDRFFSTKPEGEGTGLGLSICDRIVRAVGGSIQLESRVGRGTRVCVRLPRWSAE